ncbi:hypothetical protein C0Z10_06960 [Acidipropionibacterium jensenii]|uniref:beta-fructofuranosidase n=2 Tax=Acidipropionibacterium jensenii TaxID=1749 RepID=A0A3Q9UDN3_9ACTN|nr:glycoside hydrolase family 32 protein [Acidipropionibacterium jensenii]AZZ39532.1 hypothetical protein C0Z10_06960 [Acidipropionibacterium jensenii]MDN5978606.1 glycoside hydrolase family 32 protein [Acidipropionibacterium jensenii]QCV88970.1 glycoside hydrolase family 32 protein [Acidipropionibacterium jensenii]
MESRSVNRPADHHRPQFHICPPRGYLNDPNGPIHDGRTTHLYFQSRPRVDLDIPVEWGHATSPDLVHWTLHRPAIAPLPGGPDTDGVWSGNTVCAGPAIRAYYSGAVAGDPLQTVLLAQSDDGGASFGAPVRVVEDPAPEESVTMFRDPFVWRDEDGWSMAVGSARTGRTGQVAAIRHYRSADGLEWRHVDDLASLPRTVVAGEDTGEGWECPQILPVDGSEVALVCSWSQAGGPGQVLALSLGGPVHPLRVDDGPNFYAASVMRDSPWGPVLFGWITEGRATGWIRQAGWSGAISLPRRTWLDHGRLCCEPHPTLDSLRLGAPVAAQGATVGAQCEIVLPAAQTGTVRLRFCETEHLDIALDADANTVSVDRSRASADPRADGGCAVATGAFDDSADRPAVRVLVDGSVVEIFTSAGRSVTTRVYPTQVPPWTIQAPARALVWQLGRTVTTEAVPGHR